MFLNFPAIEVNKVVIPSVTNPFENAKINYDDRLRSIYSNDFHFVLRLNETFLAFLAQPLLMTLKIISSRNFFLRLHHIYISSMMCRFANFFFSLYISFSFFQTQTNRRIEVIRPSTPTSQQTACARRERRRKNWKLNIITEPNKRHHQ